MENETMLEKQLEELGFQFKKPKNCGHCGSEFMPKHGNQQFCSMECRKQARITYKGYRLEWKNLREFVLERDNYTCQDCHTQLMDIGLEVHHSIPLYSKGSNKESNLITLCHKCHKKRHSLK